MHVSFLVRTNNDAHLDVVTLIRAKHRREWVAAAEIRRQWWIEARLRVQIRDGSPYIRAVGIGQIPCFAGSLARSTGARIQDAERERFVAVIDDERAIVRAGDGLRAWQRLTTGALLRFGPEEGQADGLHTGRNDGPGRVGAGAALGVDPAAGL